MISFFGKLRTPRGGGLVAALVLWIALAACSPTEGDDGLFDPIETTNEDYDSAIFVEVGNNPITMDAADYDNGVSGGLDIAVINLLDASNAFNGSLSLLTNNNAANSGTVGFTKTTINIAPFATTVKFLELISGNWDIAVLVNDEDNPHVWFCIDPSTTGCTSTLTRPLPGIAAQMKRVNIDGGAIENDLLLTIPSTDKIVAILSDGDGIYSDPPVETDVASNPGKFTTGEFNADVNLYLDVAILRPSNNDVIVLAGDGEGNFITELATQPVLSNPVAITAMDLNGDGTNISFAVASDTANEVRVQANDNSGTGSFNEVIIKVDENPGILLAGDFDGEGFNNDIILMHGKSNFVGFLKGADTPTPAYTKTLVTVSRDPFAAASGFLTNSGNLDVVVASREYRAITILAGTGSGSFSYSVIGFTATTTFPIVVPTSLNFSCSSEKSDLLFLQPFSDRVVILKNKNNCP